METAAVSAGAPARLAGELHFQEKKSCFCHNARRPLVVMALAEVDEGPHARRLCMRVAAETHVSWVTSGPCLRPDLVNQI